MLMKAEKPEAINISSPAGGISKQILKAVLKNNPAEIIINSADAAAMARDMGRLKENGYLPEKTFIFDLYPCRSSSQIVMLLRRAAH
jgi:tRNA/tmRNA/rRNA uracil-C5-methylase (TrmA/RlmC/RlmD family)